MLSGSVPVPANGVWIDPRWQGGNGFVASWLTYGVGRDPQFAFGSDQRPHWQMNSYPTGSFFPTGLKALPVPAVAVSSLPALPGASSSTADLSGEGFLPGHSTVLIGAGTPAAGSSVTADPSMTTPAYVSKDQRDGVYNHGRNDGPRGRTQSQIPRYVTRTSTLLVTKLRGGFTAREFAWFECCQLLLRVVANPCHTGQIFVEFKSVDAASAYWEALKQPTPARSLSVRFHELPMPANALQSAVLSVATTNNVDARAVAASLTPTPSMSAFVNSARCSPANGTEAQTLSSSTAAVGGQMEKQTTASHATQSLQNGNGEGLSLSSPLRGLTNTIPQAVDISEQKAASRECVILVDNDRDVEALLRNSLHLASLKKFEVLGKNDGFVRLRFADVDVCGAFKSLAPGRVPGFRKLWDDPNRSILPIGEFACESAPSAGHVVSAANRQRSRSRSPRRPSRRSPSRSRSPKRTVSGSNGLPNEASADAALKVCVRTERGKGEPVFALQASS